MWLSAASVYVSPAIWGGYWALLGLAFPFCLASVLIMAVICFLCFHPRLIWIGVFGIACCYGSIRNYFPLNIPSPAPKGCLKVMSFNTLSYGNCVRDERGRNVVMEYILANRPDIIAVQEGFFLDLESIDLTVERAKQAGYEFQMAVVGISHVGLYSRLPIVRHDTVCHSVANGAAAYYLLDKRRDTLIVINAHLQSIGLSAQERKTFSQIAEKPESFEKTSGKKALLDKITASSRLRALQADTIARYIERHKDKPLILMGDFNDTPISYARQRASNGLIDTYRTAGNGLGRSFAKDKMIVRIDHIFCSNHFKPYATRVDNSFGLSDHYPIITYLKPLPPAELKAHSR